MMKERFEAILKNKGIAYKEVLVLGTFVHMSFHSESTAKRAAVLFPASHYSVKIFERPVATPHGKRRYGKEWKVVACVK